ncbi:thiamine-phosphate kinase [Iodidimonas sp. SYSU 1G8]|uniref:thiamine-phosphate kinase n=1 Tax=Iodidimonas sp. SYSU 1G8 TaxID=3133967 RepID=UPI0031FE7BA9
MPGQTGLGEFELIAELFAPLSAEAPGAFGLTDDAATIPVPPGHQLVMTKDMMVAGVHFRPQDPPALVARKLLRVNLSDLAGMGASPYGYALGLSLSPDQDDDWLRAFAAGLAEDQRTYGVVLLGGDTTSTPGPLTLSLTAFGLTPTGRILRRNGARPGEAVCVSGTIGDAALGLLALNGELDDPTGFLADRYLLPRPRVALGPLLPGCASAGLDISDGLAADIGHLSRASAVGVVLEMDAIPLSDAARAQLERRPDLGELVLSGGDDYEIAFTIPPERLAPLLEQAAQLGIPVTRIGTVTEGQGVRVLDAAGTPVVLHQTGYRHR